MIEAGLLGTASIRPGAAVSTVELVKRAGLSSPPEELLRRTGIETRYWAAPGQRQADLGVQAAHEALEMAGLAPGDLRRLIFVTSTGGDFLIPATANAVLDGLGINEVCDGFDLNNACMGFLTALDLAARMVATGQGPVAVVTVELPSSYLTPEDPRPYLVMGDAAAAAVMGGPRGRGEGVLASYFGNDGSRRDAVTLGHPGLSGQRETIRFKDSNLEIIWGVIDVYQRSADRVLKACGMTLSDVDWFVLHQPNGAMLELIIDELGLPRERLLPSVREIGSTGAASMAMNLDSVWRGGGVRPGHRLLFVGAGAGVSYGAMLYQVGT